MTTQQPGSVGSHDRQWLRGRAWTAVAGIPLFFVLAFALGEGLYSLLGYATGTSGPLWVQVVVGLPTLALFELPCVAGVRWALRARRLGDRRAWLPLGIAAGVGGWFLIITVVSTVSSA